MSLPDALLFLYHPTDLDMPRAPPVSWRRWRQSKRHFSLIFSPLCRTGFSTIHHRLKSDIGLVQKTPFQEDLPATVQKLKEFLPFDQSQIVTIAEKIRHLKCQLVVCDIAPMGIRVAKEAGVPSVLVENFTWDWIYRGYEKEGFDEFDAYLQSVFAEASYHIQTQPICKPERVDFTVEPASRKIKSPYSHIRKRLGLPDSCKVVMITAGGVPKNYGFIAAILKKFKTI
jgi:hypothetical protein